MRGYKSRFKFQLAQALQLYHSYTTAYIRVSLYIFSVVGFTYPRDMVCR